MEAIDLIFKGVFYFVGIVLVAFHTKDNLSNSKDLNGNTLTHGLLFIILAASI